MQVVVTGDVQRSWSYEHQHCGNIKNMDGDFLKGWEVELSVRGLNFQLLK